MSESQQYAAGAATSAQQAAALAAALEAAQIQAANAAQDAMEQAALAKAVAVENAVDSGSAVVTTPVVQPSTGGTSTATTTRIAGETYSQYSARKKAEQQDAFEAARLANAVAVENSIDAGSAVVTVTVTGGSVSQAQADKAAATDKQQTDVDNLFTYIDSANREVNAQGGISDNLNVQLNDIVADVGTQQVIISAAQGKLGDADIIIANNYDAVNQNVAEMAAILDDSDKYNWSNYNGGYEGFKQKYETMLATLAAYNLYLENRGQYVSAIESAKANLIKLQQYQRDFKEQVNAKNMKMLGDLAVALTRTPEDVEADKLKAINDYLKGPEGQRLLEVNSQNTKWKVGDKSFDTYAEAEAYIKAQARLANYNQDAVVMNTPNYLVDAPGMEGYASSLGIPTTQSGVPQAGWVDTQIDNVSGGLHDFARFLEAEAESVKLKGYDEWAGVYASGAIAAGVGSALFDATTFLAAPYAKNQLNLVSEFSENPLFTTGYIGGNVALILYAAGEIYSVAKTKLPASVTKWASEADGFIDVTHQPLGTPKLTGIPENVDAAYWSGKSETIYPAPFDTVTDVNLVDDVNMGHTLSTRFEDGEIAYAMVEMDRTQATLQSIREAASNPFVSLNAPLYIYHPKTGSDAVISVASALGVLGAANLANTVLKQNNAFINELSSKINVPNISTTLNSSVTLPVEIPDVVASTLQIPGVIQLPDIMNFQDNGVSEIVAPDTSTEQTPIADVTPIEIIDNPPPPIIDDPNPPTPDNPNPGIEEPSIPDLWPVLPDGKGKQYDDKDKRGKTVESALYRVRVTVGDRTQTRTVEARSFVDAFNKADRGSRRPSVVEVTWLGAKRV